MNWRYFYKFEKGIRIVCAIGDYYYFCIGWILEDDGNLAQRMGKVKIQVIIIVRFLNLYLFIFFCIEEFLCIWLIVKDGIEAFSI